jgi:hypothetical protein
VADVTQLPIEVNVKHKRGDYFAMPFHWFDDSGDINITGYTITAQIRRKMSRDSDLMATLTVEITNAAEGRGNIILPLDARDDMLVNRDLYWDLEFTTGAAQPLTVYGGIWHMEDDVSHVG